MTTLAQLANRAQGAVDDETAEQWPQNLVEEWCLEGIRDYNQHFPRTRSTTVATTADVRQYDLPADFRGVVSVEYPTGEDPPQFLLQRSRLGKQFWGRRGYFDVIARNDAANVAELVISEKPQAGQTITLEYLADHELALESTDEITVPGRHEGIIVEFCIWRAWLELLAGEQQAPTSNSSLLMSQYASNADRAKRAYVESLARALRAGEGKSASVAWRLDKWDRIY